MTSIQTRSRTRLAAVAITAAVSVVALTGCSDHVTDEATTDTSRVEESATVDAEPASEEDVVSLDDVGADLEVRVGEELTLTGAVQDVITPETFTLVDPTGTTLDPVLVVGAEEIRGLAPDQEVQVTGTVNDDFDIEIAEETLDIQLDDELLTEWQQGLYIEAQQVETDGSEES